MATGLFVGLITLDCIYRVNHVPSSDEKIVAEESLLVAGGPATNAAIAFAALGNRARLAGALGQHPLADLIRADLATYDIEIVDLTPQLTAPPPLSTILVTAATGDRAVVSRNAVGRQAAPAAIPDLLTDVDIVLIDGHQMAASHTVAIAAQSSAIPIVIDAGSWKPGFDTVLPLATSAIAAAKFQLPGQGDTLAALSAMGIAEVAITHGPRPIAMGYRGQIGQLPVPTVAVQDTLGAGDIFHGAFCHYRLHLSFPDALTQSAQVAAQSCQHFGPRAWIEHAPKPL